MTEIFPDYFVTRSGNVVSKKGRTDHILKPGINKWGYRSVVLAIEGEYKNHRVARLVAKAFLPNPKNKRVVNHKNGVRTDDRVENLEWATYGENNLHAYRVLGRQHPLSKPVVQLTKGGRYVKDFGSTCEASRSTKVSQSCISLACRKPGTVRGGFRWEFA